MTVKRLRRKCAYFWAIATSSSLNPNVRVSAGPPTLCSSSIRSAGVGTVAAMAWMSSQRARILALQLLEALGSQVEERRLLQDGLFGHRAEDVLQEGDLAFAVGERSGRQPHATSSRVICRIFS